MFLFLASVPFSLRFVPGLHGKLVPGRSDLEFQDLVMGSDAIMYTTSVVDLRDCRGIGSGGAGVAEARE